MITKFLTEVSVKFNPFSPCGKSARLFLTHLPPKFRSQGRILSAKVLPRNSTETSSLRIKFKDGKELEFNCANFTIKSLIGEADRHSRQLQKIADLTE
ncbi:hypothetical protein CDD81_2114 [Ophiocordyceps australis]|uniref:Large ribosomal subunit protein mL53 n=1 Tax=Ophiocordyceps australis TaxID=1399860 RepID=A0A2C5XYS1_9HYPO|nr:hypothetical protein CDD81_2114 [Ophiocordyceps australis]